MELTSPRVLYQACPLCESTALADVGQAGCERHPLYSPELPPTILWRGCSSCGHVFTEGWFGEEALAVLFRGTNAHQRPPARVDAALCQEIERDRRISARIVTRVSQIRGALGGRWLDVGFGNGSLLMTAEEFGYEGLGLDLRPENVERLRALGLRAECAALEGFDEPESCDVVSMADVLEHVPFPRRALEQAHRLLRAGGLVFVSAPNMDSHLWRLMDRASANPYWGELEHYHNFGRDRLYALLVTSGFEPCSYEVSERYRAGMEVVARKE